MNPLEALGATASRLVQESAACRDKGLSIRLRESAVQIRGAVASIRRALESTAAPATDRARFRLILGDENHG